jgi:hypothetical protein
VTVPGAIWPDTAGHAAHEAHAFAPLTLEVARYGRPFDA